MKSIDELMAEMTPEDIAYMKANWEGKQEQVFTHHEFETDITRHIHVTRLWNAIEARHVKFDVRMMAIDDELYHLICENQGIERSHLATITPDQAAYDEGLAIEFDGGTRHIIVDGNHKIVRAYEMGLRRRPTIFVAHTALLPFLVHPPERVGALMVAATKANTQVNVTEPG